MAFLPPRPTRLPQPIAPQAPTTQPGAVGADGMPTSFARDGFVPLKSVRSTRRIMIGTDGEDNTGKTEFIVSCPGPGLIVCLDRNYDAMLDNPTPPARRRSDFIFRPVNVPLVFGGTAADYKKYWEEFKDIWYKALANPDAVTVAIDGDSDAWELQLLVEFGRLKQIHPLQYGDPKAVKRTMIARAHDTGKIVICTHKVKAEYVDVFDANGNPVLDNQGKHAQERSGDVKRQGFSDMNYLFSIQIRHMYKPPTYSNLLKKELPPQFGIKILRCKVNRKLEGHELWGDDCCFAGLVQYCYPHVELSEWGF